MGVTQKYTAQQELYMRAYIWAYRHLPHTVGSHVVFAWLAHNRKRC